ncbi:hypothetical protein RRG08_008285 [Elysia crispata]|uniref:Uncharacterized protein n=1 Tax=Elysia crispata TaxID=231223 RepID=A0AAE0ZP66_9GAST|nr:hypothetical protein RRG08_008285 [Elysia crispata]
MRKHRSSLNIKARPARSHGELCPKLIKVNPSDSPPVICGARGSNHARSGDQSQLLGAQNTQVTGATQNKQDKNLHRPKDFWPAPAVQMIVLASADLTAYAVLQHLMFSLVTNQRPLRYRYSRDPLWSFFPAGDNLARSLGHSRCWSEKKAKQGRTNLCSHLELCRSGSRNQRSWRANVCLHLGKKSGIVTSRLFSDCVAYGETLGAAEKLDI